MFFGDDLHFCYMIILKKKPLVIKEIHKVTLPLGPPFTPNHLPQLQIMLSAKWGNFIGLAYQGKDIVFRFIIEYSSLVEIGPLGNNRYIFIWGFLKDDILACVETWEKWTMVSPFSTPNTTWKTPHPQKKKRRLLYSMMELLIGCMKFYS